MSVARRVGGRGDSGKVLVGLGCQLELYLRGFDVNGWRTERLIYRSLTAPIHCVGYGSLFDFFFVWDFGRHLGFLL